jgi:periodic tryptophan protein 2
MRFGYKFSNLYGTVYKQGNLQFTPDGGSLLSPVGNRVSVFDLENSKSVTLPFEMGNNIAAVALSPDKKVLITVDEDGRALLVNYRKGVVLNHFNFKSKVVTIVFSPCGKYFAASHGKQVQVWKTPSLNREFAPFVLHRIYTGHFDDIVCIDWSADSETFITGSRDLTAKIFTLDPAPGYPVNLAGHKDTVVGAFLGDHGVAYTVARDGCCVTWKRKEDAQGGGGGTGPLSRKRGRTSEGWFLDSRHFFNQKKAQCATMHKASNLLVVGFSTGIFGLYELPSCNSIHTLSISTHKISTVSVNSSGEWLAFGSERLGQLLVWEWQSETYVLKQQGHAHGMNAVSYSPNGAMCVTGGEDSKVKVWHTATGFCFITFVEHAAAVRAVEFMHKGNAVVSASLDGTVRAFDLVRYRNFRTLTTPAPTQFVSVALDPSDEIVCAGTQDSFEIFVWSLKTGRLLDVLSGHEGPVSSLSFNPIEPVLASSSWDKSIKLWDVFESKAATQTFAHSSDVLCVAFRPDGKELASSSLDGHIYFWNAIDGKLKGSLEARRDVIGGRKLQDKTTLAAQASSSCFSTLAYSADGTCILAAGNTKWVCLYNVARRLCVNRFAISNNKSLDGVRDMLNSKRMTQGGALEEIDHDSDAEAGDALDRQDPSLPGARRAAGDDGSRKLRLAARSSCVRFSPTGRAWAAATTEGLVVFSLDEVLQPDEMFRV